MLQKRFGRLQSSMKVCGLALLLSVAALPCSDQAAAQDIVDPWPTAGQNAQRTGVSPFFGCTDGKRAWATCSWNAYAIAIGSNGVSDELFVNANGLNAVNLDGSLRWRLPVNSIKAPAIGPGGILYYGSDNGFVYAIDPNSEGAWIDASHNLAGDYLKWDYEVGVRVQGIPLIGSDGTVYIGAENNLLYALDSSGLKWKAPGPGTALALSPDGKTIYSWDGSLRALQADTGVLKWSLKAAEVSGAAVDLDGSIYITTAKCNLVKISALGKTLWSKTEGRPSDKSLRSSPSLDLANNRIYVGGKLGLYAYNLTGTKLGFLPTSRGWHGSPPSIGADGTVYVKSFYGDVHAVDPADPKNMVQKWVSDLGAGDFTPAIGSDGTVYAGGSALHAFRDGAEEGRPTLFWLKPRVLVADADPVDITDDVDAGTQLNLIVAGVHGGDGLRNSVDKVDFYWDRNGDGAISVEGTEPDDVLVGTDTAGAPWQCDVDTTEYPPGRHTFLAEATDNISGLTTSNVVSATINIVDAAP